MAVVTVIVVIIAAAEGREGQREREYFCISHADDSAALQYLTQISAFASIPVSAFTPSSDLICSAVTGFLLYAASLTHTICASSKIARFSILFFAMNLFQPVKRTGRMLSAGAGSGSSPIFAAATSSGVAFQSVTSSVLSAFLQT